MREQYWNYYVSLSHSSKYLELYRIHCQRINRLSTGILFIISAVSISSLASIVKQPFTLGIIALAFQILQAISPLFRSAQQEQALRYYLQDLSCVLAEVENNWYSIDSMSDQEIKDLLAEHSRRINASHDRFIGDLTFPVKKRLNKKASIENQNYFKFQFNVEPEGDMS